MSIFDCTFVDSWSQHFGCSFPVIYKFGMIFIFSEFLSALLRSAQTNQSLDPNASNNSSLNVRANGLPNLPADYSTKKNKNIFRLSVHASCSLLNTIIYSSSNNLVPLVFYCGLVGHDHFHTIRVVNILSRKITERRLRRTNVSNEHPL